MLSVFPLQVDLKTSKENYPSYLLTVRDQHANEEQKLYGKTEPKFGFHN